MLYIAKAPSHCFLEKTVASLCAVDNQIAELVAYIPDGPVSPVLDARGGCLVDKDVAAYDQLPALSIMRLTETVRQEAIDTIFNDGDRPLIIADADLTGRNTGWPSITHIGCDISLAFRADP